MAEPIIVGFTGTQRGMTDRQRGALRQLLERLQPAQFHHGDCIGADAQAHAMAVSANVPVYVHPPTDIRKRAFTTDATSSFPARPYLERNHNIVDSVDVLVATPAQADEVLRSGTWSTIRYARKIGIDVIVLEP